MTDENPRAKAYDEEIKPVLEKLFELCKKHNIPMFAHLLLDDDGPDNESRVISGHVMSGKDADGKEMFTEFEQQLIASLKLVSDLDAVPVPTRFMKVIKPIIMVLNGDAAPQIFEIVPIRIESDDDVLTRLAHSITGDCDCAVCKARRSNREVPEA